MDSEKPKQSCMSGEVLQLLYHVDQCHLNINYVGLTEAPHDQQFELTSSMWSSYTIRHLRFV